MYLRRGRQWACPIGQTGTLAVLQVLQWFRVKRPTLINLPVELMDCILENLDEKSLVNVTNTCKLLNSLGTRHLYQRIWLWSTYRFAQLASRLQDRPDLAEFVRELDLSKIELKTDDQGVLLAGWRDWKFRSEPLYYTSTRQLRHGRRRSLAQRHAPSPSPEPLVSSEAYPILCSPHNHPHMSPLLQRNATSCDVPIGPVLRTVEYCKFLRVLDLSYLSLAVDYYIVRGPSQHKFVSDVPKLYNWSDDEIRTVNTGNLMEAIIQLDNLQELRLRRAIWVTRKLIERFLDFSRSVKLGNMTVMDLRESGMVRAAPWTICGTPQDIEHALDGTPSM
uniref:ARAD1D24486p n=1 Tax=Blastobotrys adeninivorans TaxID=409370 RepID=A0A060TAJ5_BLAAD